MRGKANINYNYSNFMKKLFSVCRPLPLFIGYGILGLFLFLYSFTQVDLGLTLTGFSFWPTLQKGFQYIGYFQRPVSTAIYIFLIFGLFFLYGYTIDTVKKKKLTMQSACMLVLFIFFFLVFSYPAFSYDFFNYMFTAKTVVLYHKNPYEVIPLDFLGFESWLSFMHWTHLPSAYAPLWIALTLPGYMFGFGYFIWILWNLKVTVGIFYLLTAWGIGQILKKENEIDRVMGVILFACNPLILIESLVSGHNDIVMVGCAMIALLLLWNKKNISSFFFYSLSVAFKEITIVLAPLYIFRNNRWLPLALMSIALILFLLVFKREMLPWYGVWVLPFVAIVPNPRFLMPIVYGFSLGLLLYYAPFLYFGHWNDPVPMIKVLLTVIPMIASVLLMLVYKLKRKKAV